MIYYGTIKLLYSIIKRYTTCIPSKIVHQMCTKPIYPLFAWLLKLNTTTIIASNRISKSKLVGTLQPLTTDNNKY